MSELFNPRRTQDTPQESSPTSVPNRPIRHSGDLGLEFPQTEHLELTSRAPLEKVADDLRMPRSPGDLERKPRLKASRKQRVLGSLAGLTLVTGAVVGGVALANQGEETPAPEPGNSVEPFPNETTAPIESPAPVETTEPIDKVPELSPEILKDMTSQEILEAFQIKATDVTSPTEYASVFVEKFEAMSNVGGTREEWLPYENTGKGTFATAMVEKYSAPASIGLVGYEIDPGRQIITHDRYNVSFLLGKDNYHYDIDLLEDTVTVTENANGSFDLRFTTHVTDNYDVKADIGDVDGTDPSDYKESWTLTNVAPNQDDVLYPSSVSVDLLS